MNDNIVEKDTLPEVILLMPISSVLHAIEPILAFRRLIFQFHHVVRFID
jgi:hypothetical protein